MTFSGNPWWPTQCRVCHRWQGRPLCAHCLVGAGLTAPRCDRCAIRVQAPGRCEACEESPPSFDHALAGLDYAAPWSHLLATLKFDGDTGMAQVLGDLIAGQVHHRWIVGAVAGTRRGATRPQWRRGAPGLIVPVPLSATRLRERGYNQAWLLAARVAGRLHLPARPDVLRRRKDTPRLMALDADARALHIRDAFELHPVHRGRIVGRHVAVVDDVLTTGATADEIARLLWREGARTVSVWVAARTPLPGTQQHHESR